MSIVGDSSSPASSSKATMTSSASFPAVAALELDPLLRDLPEKKQIFRKNVVSLAAELKDVRSRLASREQSFEIETQTRQEAQIKAKQMEQEICRLQKSLEDKNGHLQTSAFLAEQHMKELEDLKSQLSVTRAIATSSAASAQSAQAHCSELLKELDDKKYSLQEHEDRVIRLGDQLEVLQKDLEARESSQKQLKDEVLQVERDIMEAVAKAGASRDCELRRILEEVSPKNFENMSRLLTAKDEEITKLRDEIRIMSALWKQKTIELDAQIERHQRGGQEIKKKVLRLEFCLQDARAQIRKLHRIGERRDRALKEVKEQLAGKEQARERHDFWGSTNFKIVVSTSMLILMVFSRR